jgi:aminopeptidase N
VKGNPEPFRALVYNKAAYVLHMLEGLLGDEAFFKGLIDFQERFRYRKAGSDDLREALETASGLQLEAYFEQWVQGTKLPALRFSHRSAPRDAGFRTEVEVSGRDLPGPLPLELTVFHSGGRVTRQVLLPPEGGSYPIDSPQRPVRVEINADRRLLAEIGGR